MALRRLLQDSPSQSIHLPRVHGYLVAISFGAILPLSIVIARNFKELDPLVRRGPWRLCVSANHVALSCRFATSVIYTHVQPVLGEQRSFHVVKPVLEMLPVG